MVSSIAASGRRLTRTTQTPRITSTASTSSPTITSMATSRPTVRSISSMLVASMRVKPPGSGSARTRQDELPLPLPGTVNGASSRPLRSAGSRGRPGSPHAALSARIVPLGSRSCPYISLGMRTKNWSPPLRSSGTTVLIARPTVLRSWSSARPTR